MNLNWKIILKKADIILPPTPFFALCSGLLYITKMAGSINITRPEDKPELASAITNEDLGTETQKKLGGYWTIAVFSVDSRNEKLRKENNADVQTLCPINRDTGEVHLVSLYCDTFLMNDTTNSGYRRLNQPHFLQGPSGNISAINTNLDMKVEDFVFFNWNSAADAINPLGGVDIELPKVEFYYINAFITETVNIAGIPPTHLEGPGMQHLDGVQAVVYMRLRQMDTDFKRTERQRFVTEQVFGNAREADISTLIQVFHTVAPQIMASISKEEFMDIAYNIKNYHINDTTGPPSEQTTASLGKTGSVVIPGTLKSNVEELHRLPYDDDTYTRSGQVRDINREVIKKAVKNQGVMSMIRIAVCDDEPCFTQQISHVVANHVRDISPPPETVLYINNGQLFYDVKEGAHFDSLLLDTGMPEKDGISLAVFLRHHLSLSLTIFITFHTQCAVKTYKLSVFRYIPKSGMETCLSPAFKDASCILKQSSSDVYIIKSARRIQKLSAEDITYVYKQQKYSVITAKGVETPVRKPLAQVLEELNTLIVGGTGSFLLVERGYIVNLFYVGKLEDEQIYLDNGSVLLVSRNRLKETREAITRYWRKML